MRTSLDRELEIALQSGGQESVGKGQAGVSATAEAQPVVLTAEGSRVPRRNVGALAILLAMGAGILLLVMSSFKSAAVYAKHVDEVVASRSELMGKRLRVEGMLVHGSLERRDQPCEYRFQMERNEARLAVRYAQCVVPDTFRDVPGVEVGVTVEGKLASNGDFAATQIMAKCPSKYEQRGSGTAAPSGSGSY